MAVFRNVRWLHVSDTKRTMSANAFTDKPVGQSIKIVDQIRPSDKMQRYLDAREKKNRHWSLLPGSSSLEVQPYNHQVLFNR